MKKVRYYLRTQSHDYWEFSYGPFVSCLYLYYHNAIVKITRGLFHKYIVKVFSNTHSHRHTFLGRRTFKTEEDLFHYLEEVEEFGEEALVN